MTPDDHDKSFSELRTEVTMLRAQLGALEFERRKTFAQAAPAPAFRCVCGAELPNPLDPATMAYHQPHVLAASLDRTRDALARWRAYRQRAGRG